MNTNKTNEQSLASFWMPFTANRQFKAAPRMLASAKGMFFEDRDGRKILDGTAGLWCVNAGHGRERIADAVHRQLLDLDFAPTFQMGHPIAFEFAERLGEIAPAGLDRVFFTSSGSESVETALKIAIAYQRSIGQGTRTRLIGRERGYHGVGFGGLSVGGIVNNRRVYPSCQVPIIYGIPTISSAMRFHLANRNMERNSLMILNGWWRCTAPRQLPLSLSNLSLDQPELSGSAADDRS
jgi:beta-alanine--pyruvate transaminase